MKRFLGLFALTVPEQRVVVALFVASVLWVAYDHYKIGRARPIPAKTAQPSPSPGILP